MKRILQLSVLALALTGFGGAQAIPLLDLLNGASITAGDKVFDQFTLIQFITPDGHALDASNIDVTALNDGGLDPGPGLAYSVSNGELSVLGDDIYNFIDFAFGFRVTAAPGLVIKDNSLTIDSATLSASGPFVDLGATILEWVSPTGLVLDPSTPGYISTEFSNLAGAQTSSLTDSSNFAPHPSIFVTNDILVWATASTETSTLGSFNQRFSQQLATVPEPGTLALLSLAMVGLGASFRRRNG